MLPPRFRSIICTGRKAPNSFACAYQECGTSAEIARSPSTIDQRTRIAAFECLARYGWPDEKNGGIGLRISGKGAQVLVQHVHVPIGVSGQDPILPAVVDLPAYTEVKLGQARHIIDTAPVESPAPTPAVRKPLGSLTI